MHHPQPCSRANTTNIRHTNINGRVINIILHIIYNNKKVKYKAIFVALRKPHTLCPTLPYDLESHSRLPRENLDVNRGLVVRKYSYYSSLNMGIKFLRRSLTWKSNDEWFHWMIGIWGRVIKGSTVLSILGW